MKNQSRFSLAGFAILFGLTMASTGCGSGGSTGGNPPPPPPPTLAWSNNTNPSNLQNCGGATYSYPATGSSGSVTYTLDNSALGTINADTGLVTANCSKNFVAASGHVVATDGSTSINWPVALVNQIAYTKSGSAGDSFTDTFVVNSDGTSPTKIIASGCINPSYSEGHVSLACIASVNPQDQVQIYKTDGMTTPTLTTTLTFASLKQILFVSLSPDGKTLLLTAEAPGTFGVYSASAIDGSALKSLYQETCSGSFCVGTGAASWSHDGKTIAFTNVVNGQGTIWTMNADGTDQAAWLPAGVPGDEALFAVGDQEIFFTSSSGAPGIYTDGLDEAPSANPVIPNGNNFALSPDGGSIVYNLPGANGSTSIYVANAADGSDAKLISAAPGSIAW